MSKALELLNLIHHSFTLSYNKVFFLVFLLVFLVVFFLLTKPVAKRVWILIGNLTFYAWSGKQALLIVIVTSIVAYVITLIISHIYSGFNDEGLSPKERLAAFKPYEKKARVFVVIGLILIFGIWAFVKIGKFIGMPKGSLVDMFTLQGIIVPLGISYYTLCLVAYVMDVYWQKTEADKNYFNLLTVVTYFPHIVQGPFCRYHKMIDKLKNIPKFDYERVCYGLQLMLWGYIKKILIADRLVVITQTVFGNIGNYEGFEVFVAVFLSAFQLYADFSGCMDIVRGISSAMGIELDVNFKQPFLATGAADFWRRWHITLGGWTKEYIYLPIAMNGKFLKKGKEIKKAHGKLAAKAFSSFFPLFSVWLFTGLWHGTGLDYICWGIYWGLIIIFSQILEEYFPAIRKAFHLDPDRNYYRVLQSIKIFTIFCVGRTLTLVGGLGGFAMLWRQMFAGNGATIFFNDQMFTLGLDRKDFYVALIGIIVMVIVDILHERGHKLRESIAAQPIVIRWGIYMLAIVVLVVFGYYGASFSAASFVYGGF